MPNIRGPRTVMIFSAVRHRLLRRRSMQRAAPGEKPGAHDLRSLRLEAGPVMIPARRPWPHRCGLVRNGAARSHADASDLTEIRRADHRHPLEAVETLLHLCAPFHREQVIEVENAKTSANGTNCSRHQYLGGGPWRTQQAGMIMKVLGRGPAPVRSWGLDPLGYSGTAVMNTSLTFERPR